MNIVPESLICSTDLDFFGEHEPKPKRKKFTLPRLQDKYPEDFAQYFDLFVLRSDARAYNTRLGYWNDGTPLPQQYGPSMAHGWKPAKMRGGNNIPATSKVLAEALDRHLDNDYWRGRGHQAKGYKQPFHLGTLGCLSSIAYAYDLDNHGKLITYARNDANLVVPDLSLDVLEHLARILALPYEEHQIPRPRVISVSSDSLGLNVWILPDKYEYTRKFHPRLVALAEAGGLQKQECYPQPPGLSHQSPYAGRSVHRRPCGQGSAVLTTTGTLTGWRDQLAFYLDPGPLPTIAQVAEQLIELWRLSFLRWRPDFEQVPSERLDHYQARCHEIRAWIQNGQIQKEDRPRQHGLPPTAEIGSTPSGPTQVVCSPTGWDSLSYPERLYKLAQEGCPETGLLNWSIVQLVRHLMTYELADR